jgi:hypothetical protein
VGKDPWGFPFEVVARGVRCGTVIRASEDADRNVTGDHAHAGPRDRVEACPACGNRDWVEAVGTKA